VRIGRLRTLSGLAGLGASVSASVSAPNVPNLPGGSAVGDALNDPSAAIGQGQAIFSNAWSQGGGSITGTLGTAMAVVSDLPPGQVTQALQQAVSIGEAAAAGATAGSVIPVYGTAIGAVVGAMVGALGSISGTTNQVSGDPRSFAEQYCWPSIPLTTQAQPGNAALDQQCAQIICWSDIRWRSAMFQPPFVGTDPATGQTAPAQFSAGVSWVSPPLSTPQSKTAAWYIACAVMGQSSVTTANAMQSSNASLLQQQVSFVQGRAWYALGSPQQTQKAIALLKRWYVQRWNTYFRGDTGAGVAPAPQCQSFITGYDAPLYEEGDGSDEQMTKNLLTFQKAAACVNSPKTGVPLDFTYYWSDTNDLVNDQSSQAGSATWQYGPVYGYGFDNVSLVLSGDQNNQARFASCPDTTIVGLAEIAVLVATGVIPEKGADIVALHYVTGLAWAWKVGRNTDRNNTVPGIPYSTAMHPNFVRLIGRITALIRGKKGPVNLKVKGDKTSKDKARSSKRAPSHDKDKHAARSSDDKRATSSHGSRSPHAAARVLAHAPSLLSPPVVAAPVDAVGLFAGHMVEWLFLGALGAGGLLLWSAHRPKGG
jgi:hypothetical protein